MLLVLFYLFRLQETTTHRFRELYPSLFIWTLKLIYLSSLSLRINHSQFELFSIFSWRTYHCRFIHIKFRGCWLDVAQIWIISTKLIVSWTRWSISNISITRRNHTRSIQLRRDDWQSWFVYRSHSTVVQCLRTFKSAKLLQFLLGILLILLIFIQLFIQITVNLIQLIELSILLLQIRIILIP